MKALITPRLPLEYYKTLQKEFPEVDFILAKNTNEALSLAPDIDIAFDLSTRDFVELSKNLKWIQTISSGVNGAPFDLLKEKRILLTNAATIYGPNIADHTLALMLMLVRQIDTARHRMRIEGWTFKKPFLEPGELSGQTLLIIGLGGIGLEIARRAVGFGMRVIASRIHMDRPKPDYVESVHSHEALPDLLPQADWVNVCVPLTSNTRNLINDREFDLMKSGVHLVCATREYIINMEALLRALDSGKVSGVGLDVLGSEAQHPDHPIWKYKNVLITPHVSGYSAAALRRAEDLIRDNLQRFLSNTPLKNIVDLDLEY